MPVDLPVPTSLAPAVVAEEHRDFFRSSEQGRGHANPWGVNVDPSPLRFLRWQTQRNPFAAQKRTREAPVLAPDPRDAFLDLPEQGRVAWLGHASLLLTIDGVTVLIDPVLGWAGPVPRKAPVPVPVADLPHVDVVAITHGHYDHLDATALRQLRDRFGPDLLFVVPKGLGASLPRAARVVELGWWEAVAVRGVQVCLVPAQHWHRRRATDTNRALWGGYVVRGSTSVYHSGDTGHFGGFAAIRAVFPALDLAVLPIGAWAPRWFMADQHMDPDGAVAAFVACGARRFFAMHWNTFDLTDEPLDLGPRELRDAVERAGLAWDERFVVPAHGGSLRLGEPG